MKSPFPEVPCAENDIPVVITDAKHYAAGLLMPVVAHTGTVRRQRRQAAMDREFSGLGNL